MDTILETAQEAASLLGLQVPSTLFGSYNEGDTSAVKLKRAVNQTVNYLRREFDWSRNKLRVTIEALGAELQTGKLPADLLDDRILPGTFWDESLKREVCGPLSDGEYAETKSGAINRAEPAWMIMGGELYLTPAPPADREYSFTYMRNTVGKTSGGARLAKFTANTDVPMWSDETMLLGVIYHHRKNERFDYGQDELDFKLAVQNELKTDGGGKVLRFGGARSAADLVARMKQAAIIIPE
jgi:hypothetical protein